MTTADGFFYSSRYSDDVYEYRHVHCPPEVAKRIPTDRLMNEGEWRGLGVCQSAGWEHYLSFRPEKHILLFRRPKEVPKSQTNCTQRGNSGVMQRVGGHRI